MAADFRRKILDVQPLAAALAAARAAGKTVAQCHGCFDIVHPGHIRHLQFAAAQADVLVVSITPDSQIHKGLDRTGPHAVPRPYVPQELRAENLAALELTDFVVIDANPTAEQILEIVRPDVYVKGQEYQVRGDERFERERRIVESHGGRVVFSSGQVVFSSTALGEEMVGPTDFERHRLASLCQRHTIELGTLARLCRQFIDRPVLVVGDLLVERYAFCDGGAEDGDVPVLSVTQLDHRRFLGGAGIVAAHLAALGARPMLVSVRGTDAASAWAIEQLDGLGVECCLIAGGDRLIERTRYLADRTRLFQVLSGPALPPDSRTQRRITEAALDRAGTAAAAILLDAAAGTLAPGVIGELIEPLRAQTETLTASAGGRAGRLLDMKRVDLLVAAERALYASLADWDIGLAEAAWQTLHRTGARHLFATLGRRGLVVFDRHSQDPDSPEWNGRLRTDHLPMLSPGADDPLGHDAAMLAAATLALSAGGTLMHAAYLAAAAGAVEFARVGSRPVTADELMALMVCRGELAEHLEPEPNEYRYRPVRCRPERLSPQRRRLGDGVVTCPYPDSR